MWYSFGEDLNLRKNVLGDGLHDEKSCFGHLPRKVILAADAVEAVSEHRGWANDENDVFHKFRDSGPESGKVVSIF